MLRQSLSQSLQHNGSCSLGLYVKAADRLLDETTNKALCTNEVPRRKWTHFSDRGAPLAPLPAAIEG